MRIHCVGKLNATQRRDFSFFTHDESETFFLLDSRRLSLARRLIFTKIHFLSLLVTNKINYGYWVFMLRGRFFVEMELKASRAYVPPSWLLIPSYPKILEWKFSNEKLRSSVEESGFKTKDRLPEAKVNVEVLTESFLMLIDFAYKNLNEMKS